jgi:putative transposase
MPRGPRFVVPEIALHVVQRGHNRHDCFLHETDYLVYLANLRELCTSSGCALHAYCLMTNHVHLLLTPSTEQSCARLMRNLGQRYVQYFNKRYRRSGTLWEGRFRSCLVDSARYALATHRYIERNPVRAHMAASPDGYRWSSHGGNAGLAFNTILTPHAEYLALGTHEASRYAAYRAMVVLDDEPAFLAAIRDATNGGFALAGARLRSTLPADQLRRLERRPPGPPKSRPEQPDLLAELQVELGLRPRTG